MNSYFDFAATHPMPDEVRETYFEALKIVGNASSIHGSGRHAKELLENAREEIAEMLDAEPISVIFTSGGTEAINHAIKGIFWHRQSNGKDTILAPNAEHHATIDTIEWLEKNADASAVWLPVDSDAILQPETLKTGLAENAEKASLVTALWANNEVGSVNDVAELAEIAKDFEVPIHLDAVSALGYLPLSFRKSGADALSLSAHKIGGPVGVGALLLDRKLKLESLIHGGKQQRERSGTSDVAGAVAFAKALKIKTANMDSAIAELAKKRDYLVTEVMRVIPEARMLGARDSRLPGNVHFLFPGTTGDTMLFLLDRQGIDVSTGSACTAGVPEVSHVVMAMGYPEKEAAAALRFTIGDSTTIPEIDALVKVLPEIYQTASSVAG
ncbi:MAG: cysteine desulfurase [Microbacteriaceae bacterium]|nr:cysteine desulfurase [Microbacteriaceae bacterium]